MPVVDKYDHYEVASVTSNRQSIGDILATMQPLNDDIDNDVIQKVGPPVDFSFKDVRKLPDFAKVAPREGVHRYVTVSVELPSELPPTSVTPSAERKEPVPEEEEKRHVKYCSKAVRFNNNSLTSFDGFSTALQAVIQYPDSLKWIDLSFNDLPKISEALVEMVNLKVLYLHANVIDDIHQVDKLAGIPGLKTLTLHGNMMDSAKGYRQYVVTQIPQLQYLDFSRVTKADRDKAQTWRQLKIIGHKRKKKRRDPEE